MTDILKQLGIVRVINAAGTCTRLGASPMHPEVIAAMAEAAKLCFDMGELQARACDVIVQCTGAEAGIITSGAAAGLLVGAAACIAGFDLAKMSRLPDTAGMRNEFVVPRGHRNSYDHGVRAAGAQLVEAGLTDRLSGSGVRDAEPWEIEAAVTERTAGILYLAGADARPALSAVVDVARRVKVPVLVDAAAQLPPASNLRRFIDEGADLVVFSGGKAIGGPSASGILCGRRDLISSALLQQLDLDYFYDEWQPPVQFIDKQTLRGVPRHGIGRSCKVGKEQIVGLLVALMRFSQVNDTARRQHLSSIADSLLATLGALPGIRTRSFSDGGHADMPLVEVLIDAAHAPSVATLAQRLRDAAPAVHLDTTRADRGVLVLVPTCLDSTDVPAIGAAFAKALNQ